MEKLIQKKNDNKTIQTFSIVKDKIFHILHQSLLKLQLHLIVNISVSMLILYINFSVTTTYQLPTITLFLFY